MSGRPDKSDALHRALASWRAISAADSSGRRPKRKVSLTLDDVLLQDLQALAGDIPLSTLVNDLLWDATQQQRLNNLVDQMVAEAGEPSPEAYERVLSQWFGDDAG